MCELMRKQGRCQPPFGPKNPEITPTRLNGVLFRLQGGGSSWTPGCRGLTPGRAVLAQLGGHSASVEPDQQAEECDERAAAHFCVPRRKR